EHCGQHRSGVFGIKVDLFLLERLVHDQRAAEVDFALDLDAGCLESLRIKLGKHELFGEVLRSDAYLRNRRRADRKRGERNDPFRESHGFPPWTSTTNEG